MLHFLPYVNKLRPDRTILNRLIILIAVIFLCLAGITFIEIDLLQMLFGGIIFFCMVIIRQYYKVRF